MPRAPTGTVKGNKIRASVTLDPDLYEWVMARVGADKEFASLSHAVARGLTSLREREKAKGK